MASLEWREQPTPVPGAGEVLVAVEAASLNFPDLLIVENKYQFKLKPPFVRGSEYAGTVTALGWRRTRSRPCNMRGRNRPWGDRPKRTRQS